MRLSARIPLIALCAFLPLHAAPTGWNYLEHFAAQAENEVQHVGNAPGHQSVPDIPSGVAPLGDDPNLFTSHTPFLPVEQHPPQAHYAQGGSNWEDAMQIGHHSLWDYSLPPAEGSQSVSFAESSYAQPSLASLSGTVGQDVLHGYAPAGAPYQYHLMGSNQHNPDILMHQATDSPLIDGTFPTSFHSSTPASQLFHHEFQNTHGFSTHFPDLSLNQPPASMGATSVDHTIAAAAQRASPGMFIAPEKFEIKLVSPEVEDLIRKWLGKGPHATVTTYNLAQDIIANFHQQATVYWNTDAKILKKIHRGDTDYYLSFFKSSLWSKGYYKSHGRNPRVVHVWSIRQTRPNTMVFHGAYGITLLRWDSLKAGWLNDYDFLTEYHEREIPFHPFVEKAPGESSQRR